MSPSISLIALDIVSISDFLFSNSSSLLSFLISISLFFEFFSVFLKSFIGKFILIGFTWSISYHLMSGIRHFFWDLGYGYEIKTANLSGIIVIIGSLFLTIILWMIGKGLI